MLDWGNPAVLIAPARAVPAPVASPPPAMPHANYDSLTSMIPPNLWSLKDLLGLNLSTKSLNGNLPLDIGNLKVITQLDLSWNQLSGDIPSTIGAAQSLVNFSFAHNKLQGYIPQSLGNLIREIPTGGHFVNFTAQSFMHNGALCGQAQLQVPLCKTNKHQRSRLKIVPLLKYILPPVASTILVMALLFVLVQRRKQKVRLPTNADLSPPTLRRILYQELLQATDAFSEANLLSIGSFGSVYKGMLSDGMNIAVKVFNSQLERAFDSFDVECKVICNSRHRNLIRIISSCTNLDFRALVLEYMPNGSLDKWLYSHNYCLDIVQRLNIMIDVASALEYLHHDQVTPIVHCD
ncbi:receptor kinase-like protein Xa21 [Cornus florida]|uniref:receptor kinase-like protein Xa21 n=1 Tax=Cornus florida TaxID=4283 RepID=UPI00289AF6AD|nr:receptor kinase-like protein Xa21 [Cornus florida]